MRDTKHIEADQIGVPTSANVSPQKKIKYDVIWNTTSICSWDCAVCCVDATHVKTEGGTVAIATNTLQSREYVPLAEGQNKFEVALSYMQAQGRELDWKGKLAVLDNLAGFDVRIDISGGDALIVEENYHLLKEASTRFGKENVTLTVTGAGLGKRKPSDIAPLIGEFNFTFDAASANDARLRPKGYAQSNIKLAKKMAKLGVSTRAELPLSVDILRPEHLREIYRQLGEAGIRKLLLMRLFPVGRGCNTANAIPTANQYREAIAVLRDAAKQMDGPQLRLQCALRHLDPPSPADGNPCDLARESFGLMADGTLLLSPWGTGTNGKPIDDSFVVGKLSTTSFGTLLEHASVKQLTLHGDDNFGHCKVFAFHHSDKSDPVERMLSTADPLYSAAHAAKKVFWVRPVAESTP
jgi:MoaA/NifB/PqqE/SkfB family radical SAM enzyme